MSTTPRFAFTKIRVDDLDLEAAFYKETFGLEESMRINFGDGDEAMEEVILSTSRDDDSNFILWRYPAKSTPPAGEATIGFMVDSLEETLQRALTNGASIIQPVATVATAGVTVALIADPEGHALEIFQYLQDRATV